MKHLLLTGLLVLFTYQAQATTLMYKNFDQLVLESTGIVLGSVSKVSSHYDEDGEIVSVVTLNNLDIVDGMHNLPTLQITIAGGQVGEEFLDVEGMPQFDVGDEVLLFVNGNSSDDSPTVGWEQGALRIQQDPSTKREIITDHVGNRIYGIQDNLILKEQRIPANADIFDVRNKSFVYKRDTATSNAVAPKTHRPVIATPKPGKPLQTYSDISQDDTGGGDADNGSQTKFIFDAPGVGVQTEPEAMELNEFIVAIEAKIRTSKKTLHHIQGTKSRLIARHEDGFKDTQMDQRVPLSRMPEILPGQTVLPRVFKDAPEFESQQ